MKMKKLAAVLVGLMLAGTLTACKDEKNAMPSSAPSRSVNQNVPNEQPTQISKPAVSSEPEETVHSDVKKLVDDLLEADREVKEAQEEYDAFEKKYGGFDYIPREQLQTALGMLNDIKAKAQTAQDLAQQVADLPSTRSDLNDKDLEYCQNVMDKIGSR